MSITSTIERRGRVPVPFAPFTGERVYMREFTRAAGLPVDLRHWQPTVDAMLDGLDAEGPIWLMIDQSPVRAGQPQRRPGLHVDGLWDPTLNRHRGDWSHRGAAQTIVLASDVLGGRAYLGSIDGQPGAGGDCSHLDASGLTPIDLEPGVAWAGPSLSMIHESIPVRQDALRTLVRLNIA